ncbi:MAG: ATP-binding cassette domain-containing protein [Phycisphaerales bacterium]|nr:ATP-binding cassette domain-containing protein [Phycisphaerales bacterium]
MRPLTALSTHIRETEAAAGRVLESLAMPVEPVSLQERSKLRSLPRHQRDIVFEQVTVRYPGAAKPAVVNVTLEVKHGRTVAIVGGNGAGKSTLLNLLPRLIEPEQGRVLVDGADLAGVNLRTLRNQIAMVTQQTILFEGTIAENIAYGRRWDTMENIIAAAQWAYADEFISELPHGYQHMLGEQGSGLSGGQRQRLCIARAILRDPAILILDEATSQIDADSEAKITQALSRFRHGRTTFIIAHRLSTVVDADVIVVMDQVRSSIKAGTANLLGRCGLYQNLVQNQLVNGTGTEFIKP